MTYAGFYSLSVMFAGFEKQHDKESIGHFYGKDYVALDRRKSFNMEK